jgi:hypothetical protein
MKTNRMICKYSFHSLWQQCLLHVKPCVTSRFFLADCSVIVYKNDNFAYALDPLQRKICKVDISMYCSYDLQSR